MNKNDFLAKFADILQTDETITLETELEELEDWDSLTKMSTVSWMLENKIQITVNDISKFKTVGEIAKLFNIQ